MLTIVGCLWQNETYHSRYSAEQANVWARMIHRHLSIPHRFVLFTDQPDAGYDPLIEPHLIWKDYLFLGNPHWRPDFPQCYARLKLFSRDPELCAILGPRFVSIDLDCVVTGNLDKILGRREEFLMYRHPVQYQHDKVQPYNCSLWMMDTGCRPRVWEDFRGEASLKPFYGKPKLEHFLQTDQGWMCYKLGTKEKGWAMKDGIYMFSWIIRANVKLPADAKMVIFNGRHKPWDLGWIASNYA
jgi:hypothetical protein